MNRPGSPNMIELEVEPLSDLSWQRIERKLMAALDEGELTVATQRAPARSRRWAVAAGVASMAAAAAIAMFWLGGDEPASTPFRGPSRFVTSDAPSQVSVGDVALTVAPQSAVLVDDQRAGGVLVVLERGGVECQVAPRGGRPPLTVQAGDVKVEVLGTRFGVSREGDSAQVVVYEGVVTVVSPGSLDRVVAGERWPREEASNDDGQRTPRHKPHHRKERVERASHEQPQDEVAPASEQDRYEAAASLEVSDPDAARTIYRQLAAGHGAWAANALFAHARLELDLGNERAARALLDAYLERFPDGANATDARSLLERTE